MLYGFIQDVPADEGIYAEVRAKLGADQPTGLVSHVVLKGEGGLRYIDVWQTRADWERFRDERVEPAVSEVLAGYGIAHDHSLVHHEEVAVVDAWIGHPTTTG
jgi:hypothetical protein